MKASVEGIACSINLVKEANGYSYTVRSDSQVICLGGRSYALRNDRIICQGWTAGTRPEAITEAKQHATNTIRKECPAKKSKPLPVA